MRVTVIKAAEAEALVEAYLHELHGSPFCIKMHVCQGILAFAWCY